MVVGPLGPSCGLMDSTNSNWKTQQNYVCNEHVKIFLFPHRYYLKISLGRLFFFWREMKEDLGKSSGRGGVGEVEEGKLWLGCGI